ncbi:MAG: rRNA maturation RNase YbeY [Eubacterium sp.]|nr:rRNA maturation RNase YbeY [Eubacterium sp.]
MIKVFMSFRNDQKAIEVPKGLRTVIRRCVKETLKETDYDGDWDVSVTLVDNEQIKQLNKQFRGKNKVTDVISFPLGAYDIYDVNPENGGYMLGDIVISMEKAHAQAIEYGHSLVREVAFLATHSTLHLLGYTHEDDPGGEKIMNELQDRILNNLDIKRPEIGG